MTITKRRGKQWSFRKWVRTPSGTVRVTGVPTSWGLPNTRAGAEEALRLVTNLAREGKPWRARELRPAEAPRPKATLVKDFADTFLEISEAQNKHSAYVSKRSIVRTHIVPDLGHLELAAVTYAVVEDFKLALRKKIVPRTTRHLSSKTVNEILHVLHRMLVVAVKRGLISVVPEFEWLRVEKPKVDFLTFDEAKRLVPSAEAGEWRTMVLIGLKTGMRQGELLGLRWDDVDLVAGKITVNHALVLGRSTTPKSHKAREIPLSGVALASLKAHRHLRGPLVFCQPDGSPWTANQAWNPLVMACKRAGLRRVSWHVLRHTFASHLVMRGVPLRAVQELLGHSTIQMTMRYAHLAPGVTNDAVALLDDDAPTSVRRRVPDGK